jgi:6-pyruvoyltetrahydropterin/6-carboxytetrahydropterin synthase
MAETEREYVFRSTKTYTHSVGLSACFRQWRADSHCNKLHGYALSIKLTFEGALNERNWVQDFGGLKPFKQWLEDTFDHKTLVAHDDPMLSVFNAMQVAGVIDLRVVQATGCEMFAKIVMDKWYDLYNHSGLQRVRLVEVEVREHEGNSAICKLA